MSLDRCDGGLCRLIGWSARGVCGDPRNSTVAGRNEPCVTYDLIWRSKYRQSGFRRHSLDTTIYPRLVLVVPRRNARCRRQDPGGRSSVGRALEWHSRGQGFDSPRLHLADRASRRWRVPGRTSERRPTVAGIAQLVEHNLAKVGVAGSSPVSRSLTADGHVRSPDEAICSSQSTACGRLAQLVRAPR